MFRPRSPQRQRLSNGSIESDPACQHWCSTRKSLRRVTPDRVLSFIAGNPMRFSRGVAELGGTRIIGP